MIKDFLERFPEFDQADEKLLSRVINEAKNELNPSVWGELYGPSWHYLAADKLALSPMGQPARLEASSNKTTYRLEFERLCSCVSMGARVV